MHVALEEAVAQLQAHHLLLPLPLLLPLLLAEEGVVGALVVVVVVVVVVVQLEGA